MNHTHAYPHAGPSRNGARWYAAIVTPLEAAGVFEGALFIVATPQHTSVEHREIFPEAGVTTARSTACM